VARRLLAPLLAQPLPGQTRRCKRLPSVAQLGRLSRAAAVRAAALLPILDAHSRNRVEQAAGDEIFFGRKPCLMVVEQHSLCWVTGCLADQRDGATWAKELEQLPQLKQLTRDGGTGLRKGLALVNQQRPQQDRAVVADQEDHFHALREGSRALRRMQGRVSRLVEQAEQAQRREQRKMRQSGSRQGVAAATARAWRQAEEAMDQWSVAEHAWTEVSQAVRLFTPNGELNSRQRAEARIQAALPALAGPEWSKARSALTRPELLTFLDEAQSKLAALPVAAEVREAAVTVIGLKRSPEALAGNDSKAATVRGILLAASLVLSLSEEAGAKALSLVRGVLGSVWRASSLVECINSVARMQQARHRKMTQGLLDLKRLYWNCREFRTGRRRKQTPYGLLGVQLPTEDWWELLKLPPEQLRLHLSALGGAA